MRIFVLVLSFSLWFCLGCDSDAPEESEESTEASSEETQRPTTGGDEATAEGTSTPAPEDPVVPPETEVVTDDGPCPDVTNLVIAGTAREDYYEDIDGPIPAGTAFADVSLGSSVDVVVASFEMEPDPQFGLRVPVGVPSLPDGGFMFRFSIHSQALAPGEFTEDESEAGRMSHISLFHSSGRINPLGDHTIVITEITEDHFCGEITGVGETSLQRFPTISGRFNLPVQ